MPEVKLEVATFTSWSSSNLPGRYYVVRRGVSSNKGYVTVYANKSDIAAMRNPVEDHEFLSVADALAFALFDIGWDNVEIS